MREILDSITLVIPSLEPNKELIDYISQLIERGIKNIVVVNDGSNKDYDFIYENIAEKPECVVLTHEVNRGKGRALKTAYEYIKEHRKTTEAIITVDSDGQHTIHDVCKVAEELLQNKSSLILGGREFSGRNIPVKSKFGNRSTSCIFYLLYGKWFEDTQTGLRGFGYELLDEMLCISGERFEYEMQVLIQCIIYKIPIIAIPIETIYDNNNEGTHFQAIRDSVKIMRVLFGNFVKFCISSLLGAGVDLMMAWLLLDMLKPYMQGQSLIRIGVAVSVARVISIGVNYTINHRVVFKDSKGTKNTLMKYLFLCVIIMFLSIIFVYLTSTMLGVNEKVAKVVGDTLLFLISYKVQRIWVF